MRLENGGKAGRVSRKKMNTFLQGKSNTDIALLWKAQEPEQQRVIEDFLITKNERMIHGLVPSYYKRFQADLFLVMAESVTRALKGFKKEGGAEFNSYWSYWMRSAVSNWVQKHLSPRNNIPFSTINPTPTIEVEIGNKQSEEDKLHFTLPSLREKGGDVEGRKSSKISRRYNRVRLDIIKCMDQNYADLLADKISDTEEVKKYGPKDVLYSLAKRVLQGYLKDGVFSKVEKEFIRLKYIVGIENDTLIAKRMGFTHQNASILKKKVEKKIRDRAEIYLRTIKSK